VKNISSGWTLEKDFGFKTFEKGKKNNVYHYVAWAYVHPELPKCPEKLH
jgi:hypothetical protein